MRGTSKARQPSAAGRSGDDRLQWGWALALAGTAALVVLLLKIASPFLAMLPCPFRALTGWPCVNCGGMRSLLAFFSLEIVAAIRHNPLVALSVCGLLTAALLGALERLLRRPLLSPQPLLRQTGLLRAAAALLMAANWLYLAAAGR